MYSFTPVILYIKDLGNIPIGNFVGKDMLHLNKELLEVLKLAKNMNKKQNKKVH